MPRGHEDMAIGPGRRSARWTPERVAMLRAAWPTARSVKALAAELSRLPGPEVRPDQVSAYAAFMALPRREWKRTLPPAPPVRMAAPPAGPRRRSETPRLDVPRTRRCCACGKSFTAPSPYRFRCNACLHLHATWEGALA